MSIDDKQQRAQEANRVLGACAAFGRRFFYNQRDNRTSRFELDERGRVWFIDDYRAARIYTHYEGRWRGFSHGGTMKALVVALRDYIRTGTPIAPGYFGPWPAEYCDGDLWGYGPDMALVREAVLATQAVRKPAPAPVPSRV